MFIKNVWLESNQAFGVTSSLLVNSNRGTEGGERTAQVKNRFRKQYSRAIWNFEHWFEQTNCGPGRDF